MGANRVPSLEEAKAAVARAEKSLLDYLNEVGNQAWIRRTLFTDPVRTKNLEKMIAHLDNILIDLASLPPNWDATSLHVRLDRLPTESAEIKKLSSANVWELTDALERELVSISDDAYLHARLSELQGKNVLDKYFPDGFTTINEDFYADGMFEDANRKRIRAVLTDYQEGLSQEYRRDRAKIELRKKYLVFMTCVLLVLLVPFYLLYRDVLNEAETAPAYHFSVVYVPPSDQNLIGYPMITILPEDQFQNITVLVGFVMAAGATGSVFSRLFRLSRQPLNDTAGTTPELPALGLRALMSDWSVFLAQPLIGAISAFIVFLALKSGVIQIADIPLTPSVYGLFCFFAGFSEPFLLNTLGRLQTTV